MIDPNKLEPDPDRPGHHRIKQGRVTPAAVITHDTQRDVIRVTLPVPPSLNRAYAPKANGKGLYKTPMAKRWQSDVQWMLKGMQLTPLDGDVVVRVDWYPARNAGDNNNLWKLLLDALEGYCYTNDRQVIEETMRRHPKDPDNPRIELTIRKDYAP